MISLASCRLLTLWSLVSLAACGGGVASSPTQMGPNAPGPGEPGTGSPPPSAPSTNNALGAHKLAVAAVSCWFGGIWADAIGEPPENRKGSDEARCNDVVRQVWGTEDKTHYEQLRALDEHAVSDVISKVGDGSASGRELRAFAEAQREALDARRAGDRVKKDMSGERERDKLTPDEANATRALTDDDALDALFKLNVGDLTHEAHALAVLTAMGRLESSRGLPRHLKIYAMQAPLYSLFGAPIPTNLPSDATQPLPKGGYLVYVSDAAKAAGHPVPDTAKTTKERESLAWSALLEGIVEKLRPDLGAVPTDSQLPDVLDRVVHRLEAAFKAERNAAALAAPAAAPTTPGTTPAPATAKPPAPVIKTQTVTPKKAPTTK